MESRVTRGFSLTLNHQKNMFQRKIQLSESELLSIYWDKNWSNLNVKCNNQDLGNFPDRASLELGKWLLLPSGKSILVRLVKKELEVWYDNKELVSGLRSGQSDDYANAWKALLAYGILLTVAGIVTLSVNDVSFQIAASSSISLLGLAYVGLALWARKTRVKLPLHIALVVHSILTLLSLFGGLIGFAIFSVLVYYLYKGVKSEINQKNEVQYAQDDDILDNGI